MHDPRSALGRALDVHQRPPSATFRDDGGTPFFRAAQAGRTRFPPRFWIAVTILWLIPALVPLAGLVFLGIWFVAGILVGIGTIPPWAIGAVSVLLTCRCLPRSVLSGQPLAFWGQSREIRTRGDLLLDLGRSYFVTIYAGSVALFWGVALIVLVAWLNGAV